MRQITEHTILAMPDAMKEIEERDTLIERLRGTLETIIEHDQEAGAAPPGEMLRRVRGFNIDTWDGECAMIARNALSEV